MDGGVMLAVARAELAPETFEALAPLGFEEVVRVFRERQEFAARRRRLAQPGRLRRGEVRAHALAFGEALGELGQVFEQARAVSESLRRVSESLGDSRQSLFERNLSGQRGIHSRRRATETLAHIALGLPGARRQAPVRQRVELPLKAERAPPFEPRGERRASLLTRAPRAGRDERTRARQQTRPLDQLLRQRRSLACFDLSLNLFFRVRLSGFLADRLRAQLAVVVDASIVDSIDESGVGITDEGVAGDATYRVAFVNARGVVVVNARGVAFIFFSMALN